MKVRKFRIVISRYWYPIGFYVDQLVLALNLGFIKLVAEEAK